MKTIFILVRIINPVLSTTAAAAAAAEAAETTAATAAAAAAARSKRTSVTLLSLKLVRRPSLVSYQVSMIKLKLIYK